jgi:hypothetical protein
MDDIEQSRRRYKRMQHTNADCAKAAAEAFREMWGVWPWEGGNMTQRLNPARMPKDGSARAAPFGRTGARLGEGGNSPLKFHLQRLPINASGYDTGGVYWGHGALIWLAQSEDEQGVIVAYLRAKTRDAAKDLILAGWPNATFYK